MEKRKLIQNAGGSRGIITLKMAKTKNSTSNLPVVGSIACGSPLLAEENIECYLPIPNEFLGNGEFFILSANGESMIDAGICDGDYVIISCMGYESKRLLMDGQDIFIVLLEKE